MSPGNSRWAYAVATVVRRGDPGDLAGKQLRDVDVAVSDTATPTGSSSPSATTSPAR